jgi:EpsI family protein
VLSAKNTRVVTILLALGAAVMAFGGVITTLVNVWSTNYIYSYGFAVPVIAAYIWWSRKSNQTLTVDTPDYFLGIPAVVAAVVLLVIGRLGAIALLEHLSLFVAVVGLILLAFGRRTVLANWFALAYLTIAIPVWNYPINALQDPSRLLSSKIATAILHMIGVPALRDGTRITLSTHTLAVMRECSGVNQLIALAAMIVPAAYVWLPTVTRRLTLVSSAVVISYLGNGARIALVGWLAIHGYGDGDPNGRGHLMEGLAVSLIDYLIIGVCFSLLTPRASRESRKVREDVTPVPVAERLAPSRRVWLDVAICGLFLVAAMTRLSATEKDVDGELRGLDRQIGAWTYDVSKAPMGFALPKIDDDLVDVGRYRTETGERHFQGADDELVRSYRLPSGKSVQLYVAYYRRQGQGKELSGDASRALQEAATSLDDAALPSSSAIREIVRVKNRQARGVLFWYDVNGRVVGDVYRAKAYMIWDMITSRRSNGAVVMIGWSSEDGAEAADARQRAIEFARAITPVLARRLPS